MRRSPALAWLVLTFIAGSTAPADARDGTETSKPCEAFWQADVVFIGVVRTITKERVTRGFPRFERTVFTFDVLDVPRGEPAPSIVLTSQGSSCDYQYEVGESYIVYASRYDRDLTTSDCSRTARLSEAAEDLTYIRGLSPTSSNDARGWLTGEVRRNTYAASGPVEVDEDVEEAAVKRAIGYPVSLTLKSADVSLVVDSRDARIDALLPPGGYMVEARAPEGFYATASPGFLVLTDPRGCATINVVLEPDGHASGQVLDADGRPVAGLPMNAVPAAAADDFVPENRATTGEDGSFDIAGVRPGTYRVFPAVPGPAVDKAAIGKRLSVLVEIAESAREDVGQIRLPRGLDLRTIRGTVVDALGAPVSGANVWLDLQTVAADEVYGYTTSDDEGRFILAIPPDRRFVVHALHDRYRLDERGKVDVFLEHDKSPPVSDGAELLLTLKRSP